MTKSVAEFRIEEIGVNSPWLESVVKLHTTSKDRLGPFPRGAFEDHAKRGMILAAITPQNTVAAYLLYRVAKSPTKNRATIVHLTRDVGYDGRGAVRLLVNTLKARTRHLLGISLNCRRDYGLDKMWQAFGFTVRHTKRGRGANGALLDCWWFDHNHDDLFSLALSSDNSSDTIFAAIDANIFYDLVCENRPHANDTRVLEADWMQDSVTLCITKEIYSEIHRSQNESEKKRCRAAAQEFRDLKTEETEIDALELELRPLFNDAKTPRDASDMRQIAHAIAADVPFFVTRDTPMLSRSEAIFEKYGLHVLHPTDMINRFDVLRREAEYRPVRLEGSSWRERLIVSDDVSTIISLFKHSAHEQNRQFELKVRHYLTKPQEWISKVIAEGNKIPTVYVIVSASNSSRIEIPLLRHTDHPLSGTLLRHLLHKISTEAVDTKLKVISISDREISKELCSAFAELGFVYDSEAWWKLSVTGIVTQASLVTEIRAANIPISLKERLVGANFLAENIDNSAAIRLENLFSPAKLDSSSMPCYVVSIRQSWATHFFDLPEGTQTVFDLNEKLHLGIEGAYYCSALNKHVTAPGRILWYVSGRSSMSVKACSHLEECVSGLPKELFAKFRHLGVFDWKHVLETAGNMLNQSLMVFKFSRTERFVNPIPLAELKKLGVAQPLNPRSITGEQFATIYRRGMKL